MIRLLEDRATGTFNVAGRTAQAWGAACSLLTDHRGPAGRFSLRYRVNSP